VLEVEFRFISDGQQLAEDSNSDINQQAVVQNEIAQSGPIVTTEKSIVEREISMGNNEKKTIHVQKEIEYIREQQVEHQIEPTTYHHVQIIHEQPVIHQRDVIIREIPIIIEKPEIVERHIHLINPPIIRTQETVVETVKEFTAHRPLDGDEPIVIEEEQVIQQLLPVYKKEEPDIHETEIIHEKPSIHERTVVHTERQIIQEKPEVHESRIFHQNQVVTKKLEPVVFHDMTEQPNP